MDPQVTCPRCHERQSLSNPDGYRCRSCGAAWAFVTCGSCHERFHMDPATRGWACPACGAQNGPAGRRPARIRTGPPRRVGIMASERTPLIVVVVAALVVIGVIWYLLSRNSGAPAPPSDASPSALTAAEAIAKVCGDIPLDQNYRVNALRRTEQLVRTDAEVIRAAGDRKVAAKAVTVADAMEALALKLEAHGETAAETAQLGKAIRVLAKSC